MGVCRRRRKIALLQFVGDRQIRGEHHSHLGRDHQQQSLHHLSQPRNFRLPQAAAVAHLWHEAGFGHNILSTYALQPGVCSGIGFHRRFGKPEFTERDRTIVHLVFQQVEWLHRDNAKIPINRTLLNLSQRERQVLIFLMGGDSTKQVAKRLQLSHHTVGDYVKSIYRQLGVNSRGNC